jgi:hypothetical protein
MFGALLYVAQRPGSKKTGAEVLERYSMWCYSRMEKIKLSKKVTREIKMRIGIGKEAFYKKIPHSRQAS